MVLRAIELSAWARQHLRLIIVAAVVVVAVLAGFLYWRSYNADRMERAATEFMQIQQTASSGNNQLASRDLGQFIQRYSGTVYADEGRIALAQYHLQEGDAAAAVEVLAGAAGRVKDSPVGPQAALLLAAAQQAAGDADAAVATYLAVADNARLSFRRIAALEAAAQVQTRSEKYAEAADIYRRLVAQAEPGSPERQIYEMRLAEVQAKAE